MSAKHDPLSAIFERLDEWRHFPTYQFERRVDIFFAVYLPEVIEAETKCALSSVVIPEFPVLKGLIWKSVDAKLSVKVDYCLFAADMSCVFFVELKTDRTSRRAKQDHYLAAARTIGFRAIVEGILEIAGASKHRLKYWRLISKLLQLGFLSSRRELSEERPKSNREVGRGCANSKLRTSILPSRSSMSSRPRTQLRMCGASGSVALPTSSSGTTTG